MKNILLPTILGQDTATAIESAIAYADGRDFELILLLTNDSPSDYSALSLLRSMHPALTPSQQNVLENCRNLAYAYANATLRVQQQQSLSSALLRNMLSAFEIGLVIVPRSYRESSKKINRYCLALLANSRCPILNLCDAPTSELQKALYLEYSGTTLQVADVQQQLDGKFPFRIVSQAKIEREAEQSLQQVLSETITRNDIDLLVETRKPSKVKIGKKVAPWHESLKMPVLSVFEEIS